MKRAFITEIYRRDKVSVLNGLQPERVFYYFEKIASIPHGSGNISAISAYIASFAEEKGLDSVRDDPGNVIIRKPGTAGYEDKPVVILQGHMDMVCEKDEDCDLDMESEGLILQTDGSRVTAKGTTLGGDDGVAVAIMLAILESDDIAHPPIEAVFTVDEEIGMLGAAALDMSELGGHILINIDSEDEGVITAGCAGGALIKGTFSVEWEDVPAPQSSDDGSTGSISAFRIGLTGLIGGHSGIEIDKNRANAHVLLGRVLEDLAKDDGFRLSRIDGGSKDNVIPTVATAIVMADKDGLRDKVIKWERVFADEFASTDPDIHIGVEECDIDKVMSRTSQETVISALRALPNGVQRMSPELAGTVRTSLNIGVMNLSDNEFEIGLLVRSSVTSEKEELIGRVCRIIKMLGGDVDVSGDYPCWSYRRESPLRDHMVAVYKNMYGHEPKVESVHAGVECGFFDRGIADLDAVSIGPDLKDIHTPAESMGIESVRRIWEYLLEVLKTM